MGVAAFFYPTMTTGATAGLVEGRIFYWGRYIDWVITTPLLLLDLALSALPNWRRNAGLIAGLIALDVFMILTGLLAGSSTSEFARGFWFLVSTAAMVALLYLVYTKLFSAAQSQPGSVQGVFRTLALLTIVLWSLYPIVWLLGRRLQRGLLDRGGLPLPNTGYPRQDRLRLPAPHEPRSPRPGGRWRRWRRGPGQQGPLARDGTAPAGLSSGPRRVFAARCLGGSWIPRESALALWGGA